MITNKVRKYPLLIALAGVLFLTFSGCTEDFFNKEAGDRITPDQHYAAWEYDLIISTKGVIASLQEFMPKLIVLNGLRSDMMDVTEFADPDLRNINEHRLTVDNKYIDASDLYKVIVNVNEVLMYIDTVRARDVDFDEYIAFAWTGELIAMRSWAYFTAARLFGEVSYIQDNLATLPDSLQTISKAAIIDTLINQILPYIYDPASGYAEQKADNFVNPKGLLGELYLEKGDFANAIVYLKKACESFNNDANRYKVTASYKDQGWQDIFVNAESQQNENISVIPFDRAEDQNNPLALWFGHDYDYTIKPTQVLIDLFMSQEPSAGPLGDLYRGLGVSFGIDSVMVGSVETTEAYISKYAIDSDEPTSSDIIIQRAADLHLLLAEAYNCQKTLESQNTALMFLNAGVNAVNPKPAAYTKWSSNIGIRGRVYLKAKIPPPASYGDARSVYIEDLLLEERQMELAFEGKRWFDLVRIAERNNDPKFLADKVAKKFEGTALYDEVHAKLMDPKNWYLPVD